MRRRRLCRFVPLALAAPLLAGCVSSLREPPPVGSLGGGASAAVAERPDEVGQLLARAAAAFARRPDPAAVTEARELYLAAARADERRIEGLLGAAEAGAWLVEHETDPARRAEIATEGVQASQWCLARAPERIDCDYRLALALGQQARERPATAADALPRIVALLTRVSAVAPRLDEAGGHRVLALVLLRAPGWPAGPGDPESGLEQAREAVRLSPVHPPNLLAWAEALARTGEPEQALAAYAEAEQLARQRLAAGDPDASEWVAQATDAAAALR